MLHSKDESKSKTQRQTNAVANQVFRGKLSLPAVPAVQKLKDTIHVPGVGDVAGHGQKDHKKLKSIRKGLEDPVHGESQTNNHVVFRGDSRHWSEIFKTGFNQQSLLRVLESGGMDVLREIKNLEQKEILFRMPKINVSGEKVMGGISTSTDESTARRKYGVGGYVYAINLRSGGYDFRDQNDLEEINAVGIPPKDIIGVIGPIREVRLEKFGPADHYEADEVKENPYHTVNGGIAADALNKLMSGARIKKSMDDSTF